MLQKETIVNITDNSGGKSGLIIGIQGFFKRKSFEVGDVVKITIKKATPHSKVKKGEIYLALIVRTKYGIRRENGELICFSENSVVLLNASYNPIGTSVFGDIPKEITRKHKQDGIKKILSIVKGSVL